MMTLPVLLVMLAGLGQMPVPTALTAANTAPDLPPPAGWQGVWLVTPALEVFVATAPLVRVLVIRRPGGAALLRGGDEPAGQDPYVGLRTYCIEPNRPDDAPMPADRPGRVVKQSALYVWVESAAPSDDDLQLQLRIELHPDQPRLRVEHALLHPTARPRNPRQLALWSLAAFPRQGMGLVSFGQGPRLRRTVSYFHWTRLPQPSIELGLRAAKVDFAAPIHAGSMKLGVVSNTGWWAYQHGRDVLASQVAFVPEATYPEGGSNITIFQAAGPPRAWAELEQVGPLQTLPAHGSLRLVETLVLLQLDGADTDAALPPDADAWHTRMAPLLDAAFQP